MFTIEKYHTTYKKLRNFTHMQNIAPCYITLFALSTPTIIQGTDNIWLFQHLL